MITSLSFTCTLPATQGPATQLQMVLCTAAAQARFLGQSWTWLLGNHDRPIPPPPICFHMKELSFPVSNITSSTLQGKKIGLLPRLCYKLCSLGRL